MSTPLPSFRQRSLSLSSLNVPRRFHLPIILLRLLCLIPAGFGLVRNTRRAWAQPLFDETGIFENKTTPLIYSVALLWCILAGYWSWILTTSMLRRWLYHYELKNALVRLVTLTVINWSLSAFIGSYYGADQPLWNWMTVCFILLVSNILKLLLASNPKYAKKSSSTSASSSSPASIASSTTSTTSTLSNFTSSINHRSTLVRVLVLPLFIVVVMTMFATLHQVSLLRSNGTSMVAESISSSTTQLSTTVQKHPAMADAGIRVMVIVLSAWTPRSIVNRQTFRETTLQLMPPNSKDISFMYRFVIGQPPSDKVRQSMGPKIETEIAQHGGDLLVLPCSDTYEDLSKKVFSSMEWAEQYEFDYFIKTDDDIFARWDTISNELLALGLRNRYWQGLSYWDIPPIRDNSNKNSELEYPLPLFPRYTAGALYILSRDIIHLIARGPRIFVKNEDQNLGVWLFPYQIEPIFDPRIQQIDVCEEDMIAKHFGNFDDPEAIGGTMFDMLDNIRSGRKMCAGFRTKFCAMCYPCQGKVNHWKDWNFNCDPVKGITLLNMGKLTLLE
ncbi:galactosyltransferase-domain-containing protein [Zychaea mexicana]|uniref:galactosyltransferase-domain-containing protein n=1 Tax=Zychaea mexicana TaxID=64656 RepID=UPI0022FE9E67|nr:galactosyltransferase-domain-containing protein [Zychaea mexicana]KAI9496609.1 galactosyltransferase-domain-containing protein [Zychaea mexicana]